MSKFCSSCGTAIAENSGFCSSCGTPVSAAPAAAPAATGAPQQPQAFYAPAKTKTTAVLLAVFLGWWSWLYTFKVNKVKFFIGAGVGLIALIINISVTVTNAGNADMYTACIDDFLYGTATLDQCVPYAPTYGGMYFAGFLSFGVWLWCLIDNARKPQTFYQNFPNEK